MKQIYLLLYLFNVIYFSVPLQAQINAGNDTTICRMTPATLNAQVTNQPGATVYQFTTIPYSPETFDGTSLSLTDDFVTGALPIGFQFCFIGNSYTQFYLSSNGWISFSPNQPITWISQPIPSTDPAVPKNCIMAPWMDWNPGVGGNIYYKTIGTAPNRKLVVSFVNVPLYGSGCGSQQGTFQIVINEGTNIINNFIQIKPVCTSGGVGTGSLYATQGVHNIDGTVAYTVPGRNNTQWIATNEGTQFFPTGPALYTVTWRNLAGSLIGSGNSITVYPNNNTTYVAKVVYNCSQITYYDTVVVNVSPPIVANTTTVNASCNGATDGSATTTVTGGTLPYSYNWSTAPPQNTATASNIGAGNYLVTVTDAIGCSAVKTATISQPPAILVSITKNNPSCSGINDGDATANVIGGVAPLSYLWSNGQTTATATGLTTGSYTITVTDNTGCEKTATVTLSAPPPFSISVNNLNPLCNGGTGSLTAVPAGGVAPYIYNWSSGASGNTVSGLIAGNYTVTVTDSKGCTNTAAAVLTEPPALTASAVIENIKCAGGNSGKITLNITNGTAPFQYNWSNGSTANPIQNLSAGTYTVTVTDSKGCTVSSSHIVTEPAVLTINIAAQNPNCAGAANGSVSAAVTGGTSPFSYNWSSGNNTATVNNLPQGTYTVTVTDANGCTQTAQEILTEAAAIAANLTVTQISCNGFTDGAASVAPSGGTGNSVISWSNGQSGNSINNLGPGSYTVSITDNNGCLITESFTIIDPPQLVLTFSKQNVSCFNGTDGFLSISVSNGSSPYSFNWSNGSISNTVTNIPAGSYQVTVTDSKGCTVSSSTVLSQPPQLQIQVSTDSVACNGGATGIATAMATGSVAPYSYSWSNGTTNPTATAMAAGFYTVTVTDNNNCTATAIADIGEPDPITSTVIVADDICVASNGGAIIIPSGGTAPYTYLWQNGNNTDSIGSVTSGSYNITVTDAKGCSYDTTVIIGRTGGISASVTKKDITCFGFDDGSILLETTGGTYPLSYSWSNNSNDSSQYNLAPGTYGVTISDNYGCADSITAAIMEPPLLTVTFSNNTKDASCFGFNDGVAEVEAAGGIPPFKYFWSTGDSLKAITDLYAGIYHIAVVDSNGCSTSDSVLIGQPAEIQITMMADTTLPLGNKLELTATVAPDAIYSYLWSPADYLDFANKLQPVAQPRVTTIYTLSVTEMITGCEVSDSVHIEVKDPRQYWIPTAFSPNNDGINDLLEARGNRLQHFSMSIYNRWGKLVFTTNDINMSWDGTFNSEKLPGGAYLYSAFIVDEWGISHNATGSITLLR